jgi:Arc/MetJ-type ribon-helix-helix transcriptional regulator
VEAVVRLDGAVADVLERLVDLGYFRTRSEAIRVGVLELGKEFNVLRNPQELEDLMAARKMKKVDAEIKSGKRKVMGEDEALAKYRKELGLKKS